MQLKTTTTPYGGFGDCYHFIADWLQAQVRDSTLTVVAGGVVYRTGGVAYRTSVSSSRPSKSWWTTVTHTSRGGEVRGEEKGGGSGGEHTTLLTNTEGKLAVSKRQLESFKTSRFSTRDMASIQALSMLQSTVTPLHSQTHRHTQCCTLWFRRHKYILYLKHTFIMLDTHYMHSVGRYV